MIKNERQYRITQAHAAKFRATLDELSTAPLSVAVRKGTILAAKWFPFMSPFLMSLSLLLGAVLPERTGAVKGAPLLGAAKRTLDGEDRSEMIAKEGKAGRNAGETWSAKMVPSLAASDTPRPKEVHSKLWQAQKAGLKSQLQDLEEEIREYERLKTGGSKTLELDSLDAL